MLDIFTHPTVPKINTTYVDNQNCAFLIQYDTKCEILRTKISLGKRNSSERVEWWSETMTSFTAGLVATDHTPQNSVLFSSNNIMFSLTAVLINAKENLPRKQI